VEAVGVIPARYRSTRLEGKVLADIWGKPMIQHVYERACQAALLDRVIVATDDERIRKAVESFGGLAVMTSPHHPSGTDRVGKVVEDMDVNIVVNIQGDEPLIPPLAINMAVDSLLKDPSIPMATLMQKVTDSEELANPNVVKVVTDRNGFALYFSRSPIPYPRQKNDSPMYKHIGLYGYRKDFLLQYLKLDPSPLERTESLEQLRALENGFRIKVLKVEHYEGIGVDTEEDLSRVRNLLRNRDLRAE
jgi:3-deoxy-manno-octulosonate cytidylyltransferase (CMP-KDO synthetase)